jgi:hypothetical protein
MMAEGNVGGVRGFVPGTGLFCLGRDCPCLVGGGSKRRAIGAWCVHGADEEQVQRPIERTQTTEGPAWARAGRLVGHQHRPGLVQGHGRGVASAIFA